MKKTICLMLLLVLALPLSLYACNSPSDPSISAVSTSNTTLIQSTETDPVETEIDYYSDLPQKTYDDYEFRVMTAYSNYALTAFDSEKITGDTLSDAIYSRNRYVEEKLNIKIVETKGVKDDYSAVDNMLRAICASGDDLFDIMFSEASISAPSALCGYMTDLHSVSDLNLEKPWWEQSSVNDYQIDGKLFFVHSAMHLHYYESLYLIMFNRKLETDYNLDNHYKTVNDGNWTYDKLYENAKIVSGDKNGDGIMNAVDDVFGISYGTNMPVYFAMSAGVKYTERQTDGTVAFVGINDNTVNTLEMLNSIFSDQSLILTSQTVGVSLYANEIYSVFEANNTLYMAEVLGRVKEMRSMDSDFGLLPLPKYDVNQEQYISTSYAGAAVMFIPSTNKNYDEIGVILENIAAMSYKTVIPAYYEVNISGKQVRDEESIQMLDIMLSNTQTDISLVYGWANISSCVNAIVNNSLPIASTYKSISRTMETNLESFNNTKLD